MRGFQQKIGRIEIESGNVGEQWKEMEGRLKVVLEDIAARREEGKEKKAGWWDEEYREIKRETRRRLREWKRRGENEGE